MSKLDKQTINKILSDPKLMEAYSKALNIPIDALKTLLEKLTTETQFSKEYYDFINAPERTEELKTFLKGEEKGKKEGYDQGFLKGTIFGGAGVVGLGVLLFFAKKVFNSKEN